MRNIIVRLFIDCLLWLALTQCVSASRQSKNDFYEAAQEKMSRAKLNCTAYISNDWREWVREHEPPDDVAPGKLHLFLKQLYKCLHERLPGVNDTSPFPLVARPKILYNVALSEVVSLSFDGLFVSKACNP